jgi:hypothetical protein
MAFGQNIERKSQKPHGHPISSKVLPCIAHLHPKDPKRWRKENQKVHLNPNAIWRGEKSNKWGKARRQVDPSYTCNVGPLAPSTPISKHNDKYKRTIMTRPMMWVSSTTKGNEQEGKRSIKLHKAWKWARAKISLLLDYLNVCQRNNGWWSNIL